MLEDRDARPQRPPLAEIERVANGSGAVRVDEIDRTGPAVGIRTAEVDRSRVHDPDPQPAPLDQYLDVCEAVFDARSEAERRVEQSVGTRLEHRLEVLRVQLRSARGRDRDIRDVGVHDRRACLDAAQCVLGDLLRRPRHVRVELLRGLAVDRRLDDHRLP